MTDLKARAAEVLARLDGRPLRPRLVAGGPEAALLQTLEGLRERPWSALPADLDLAHLVDHTLLKSEATATDVARVCEEARIHGFASVCVNPWWVPLAAEALAGTAVRVCTVVGFPLGATLTAAKAFEAEAALRAGAAEVDMVLSVGAAKSGGWDAVGADLKALRVAVPRPAVLKVILETCLLDNAEIERASLLAAEAGLDFVKTSTGFSTGGATETAVTLMRVTVGEAIGVKASGGIRTRAQALAMVRAGATRLGLSASLAVVAGDPAPSAGGY
jgi:deoxyribose-phosphate aldolase